MDHSPYQVAKLAILSLVVTLILAIIWQFYIELPLYRALGWLENDWPVVVSFSHIGVTIGFASFAVLILSLMAVRLIRELREKDQSLRKTNADKATFAADIAHELRTPLAVMRAHLDNMDSKETSKPLSEEVDRVSRIVEQVMAKSHVDSIEISPLDRIDLCEIVSSVAGNMAPLVIKEGRSIEVVGGERGLEVNASAFALELALCNLLENAIKYSNRGSTITLEILSQDQTGETGQQASVRVIDRGRGIPVEDREIIFERFHRADRRGQGTGLGLSIVRRVAESHNGSISIDDTPGGGATFTLSI